MGGRKPFGPKGLCAYLAEVVDSDGMTSVPEAFSFLVRKCIEDKMFSENRDSIAVCRTDTVSNDIRFGTAGWEGLRSGLKALCTSEVVGATNPINCLEAIIEGMRREEKEDSYDDKKIIFFADLSSYVLNEDEVVELAEKLLRYGIFISIILPNKDVRSDLQIDNSRLLRKVFKSEKFENVAVIKCLKEAECQIINTQSKKATRPTAWNCPLEISPNITIQVGGYVGTRKNKVGEMTRVLMKQVDANSSSRPTTSGALTDRQDQASDANGSNAVALQNNQDNVAVEVAKEVLQKETRWMGNDGNVVEEENIGQAYLFGDKLVPFNELESDDSEMYRSGEKCFRVLAFCPIENINPAFHTGDGITLFYPKKEDVRSEVLFKSLLQAMITTKRIAVVRKVYLKDKKVTIGTLVPDAEKECMIFTELCFADDVSIPQLSMLVRPEDLGNAVTSPKEDLIDNLIKAKSLHYYHPSEGPVDPAVKAIREEVSRKILGSTFSSLESTKATKDTIGVMFQPGDDVENTLLQLRDSFPLKENKIDEERLAGQNVFRKRKIEAIEDTDEKKPKVEVPENNEGDGEVKKEEVDDTDDLLDEL